MKIRLVTPDGTERTFTHLNSSASFAFGMEDEARATIPRAQLVNRGAEKGQDEVYLESGRGTQFGGLLRDVDKSASAKAQLIIESFERYALDAKPSGNLEIHEGVTDSELVQSIIDGIDELEAGRIETLDDDLDVQFSHVSPGKQIRQITEITGAEIRYNYDKTVDYVRRLGQRSGTPIDKAAQDVQDLRVAERSGPDYATHLRVLGAGQGDSQITVEVTAEQFDPNTDREVWTTAPNSEIRSADSLRKYGQRLVNELYKHPVDVEATVVDRLIYLGDNIRVIHPPAGVDSRYRVQEVTHMWDSGGRTSEVKLSSQDAGLPRSIDKVRRDVEQMNRAGTGMAVAVYDNPNLGSEIEGHRVYVTGASPDYPRGVYYYNGIEYEAVQYSDVDAPRVQAQKSFTVPVGTNQYNQVILPAGSGRYDTE